MNITCTPSFGSDDAIIVCYATDYSDAPATGLIVTSPGLNEPQHIQFQSIPAVNVQIQVVSRSLSEIAAGNYTVNMTAVNLIKNHSAFGKTYYVPGNVHVHTFLSPPSLSLPFLSPSIISY